MHEHEAALPAVEALGTFSLVSVAFLVGMVLFMLGVLPIPVGYERGKVKWIMWCGTGMHAHIVYWHREDDGRTDSPGFQSIHPRDCS